MTINPMIAAKTVARLCGLAALALGLAHWLGASVPLHAHMAFGGLLVLALFTLAFGRITTRSALAMACCAAIPALGMAQLQLAWGDDQWMVQLAHATLGLGGIFLAETLAAVRT